MAVWSEVAFSNLSNDLRCDAEYYRPNYLYQTDIIKHIPHKKITEIADVSDGNHIAISESFSTQGIRYLRGQDLGDFFIRDSAPIYIPQTEYDKLKRSHIFVNDVLLGIVGTIGSVGIVTDRHGHLTGNCKIAIIRPQNIEPEYLAIFLASRVGQNEIKRRIRGTVQMGLILPDLKTIPIPLLSEKLRLRIKEKVRMAYSNRQQSEILYTQAEELLFEELGLTNFKPSHSLFYERQFSETQKAGRFDAEYYQPKYLKILETLNTLKPIRIAKIDEYINVLTNGHTPRHHDLSMGEVPFLTAEHILDFRINFNSTKRILTEHHHGELKRTRLIKGDFLLTIKGRIGNAAVVEELCEPVNINQDVALIRLTDNIPKYYLLAYINSAIGRLFVEQYCTGQINPFLGLGNIRLLPIPIFERKLMDRIAQKTQETIFHAHNAINESRRLLEEGIRMVEVAIMGEK